MSDTWYVVITKPRQEARAAEHLCNQKGEVYLPFLTVERLRQGKRITLQEPLFPGYLFLRTKGNEVLLSRVRSTIGVRSLLRFGNEPVRVENCIVDDIQARLEKMQQVKALERGDSICLKEGPFRAYQAIFQEYCGQERAVILLNLLGQQNRLVVQLSQLEPV